MFSHELRLGQLDSLSGSLICMFSLAVLVLIKRFQISISCVEMKNDRMVSTGYFDNVRGRMLEAVLNNMRDDLSVQPGRTRGHSQRISDRREADQDGRLHSAGLLRKIPQVRGTHVALHQRRQGNLC